MADKPSISLLITEDDGLGLLTTISEIQLDVRKSSNYEFDADITDYPIEDGSEISDHRRKRPPVISLEGFVSDSPIVSVSSVPLGLKGDLSGIPPSTCQTAYDALISVHNNHTPITYVGEYEMYDGMLVKNLQIPRDADKGLGFWFSLQLKHVSVVQSLTAALSSDVVKRLKKKASPKNANKLTKLQKKLRDQYTNQNLIKNGPRIEQAEADAKVKIAGNQKYLDTLLPGYFK